MSRTEKFLELIKDQSSAKELFMKQSPEEAKDYLNEKGIDCSVEDVQQIGKFITSVVGRNEELSESDLSAVAGGGAPGWPWEEHHWDDALEEVQPIADAINNAADGLANAFKSAADSLGEWILGW